MHQGGGDDRQDLRPDLAAEQPGILRILTKKGRIFHNNAGYTSLCIQLLGYKTEILSLRKGQSRKNVKVKLTPDVYGLQDIVVTPRYRKRDYVRKGNPAVELIKNVIANKDSFCVKTVDQYTAKTYSRMSFALDNLKINFQKPIWKNYAFAEKYIDTTGVYPNLTVSIREQEGEEFYQRKPHREKKAQQKTSIFGAEEFVSTGNIRQTIDDIFKEADINDNNMNLLLNRFVSPLSSSLANSFYQYYIMDTIVIDGYSCIDLAFVPVNSESFGFTGHLYVVNDSTYRLKKYAINIPPEINLNFVSNYSIEQSYKQLPSGLWAPERTNTFAKFYILDKKQGILARQTKIYTDWDLETAIPKETFTTDIAAERVDIAEWDTLRPEPLSKYESSVVDLVREFTETRKYNGLTVCARAAITQYFPTTSPDKMKESKFDIGPIYNFVSWNMLEGVRLRFGGTTTAKLHPQVFARGYVAFGTTDLRPKYEATLVYTFGKHLAQPYDGLRHHIQWTASYDVEEPGRSLVFLNRDNILMSVPTSKPTLGFSQYVFHAKMEYMKEWQNRISLKATFDFTNNEAAGVLQYNRLDYTKNADSTWNHTLTSIGSYRNYEGRLEFKYSPGNHNYINRWGEESAFAMEKDAPTLLFRHSVGFLDDRHNGGNGFLYNRTEFQFDQRFWFSSFGCLDTRIQTGIVWQKVPFTQLFIPKTSTNIMLATRGFNAMKPMEFIMDRYVAWYLTYHFNGWILNRIPGINRLKLRGVVSFSGIYGDLSKKNNPYLETNSGLYELPHTPFEASDFDANGYINSSFRTASPIDNKMPYLELTAGFENIFKFLRIDYIRRLTYNDYELPYRIPKTDEAGNTVLDENGEPVMITARRKIGAWGRNGVKLTLRFAL